MKNIYKGILFVSIFLLIYTGFSYLVLPSESVHKYGMMKTSRYEILSEKPNTIDTLIIGDSLVYSSVSPMEIYEKYGYTVFDCSRPAQLISDAYEYFKVAVDTQKPKVVMLESNVLFRDESKQPIGSQFYLYLENALPLVKHHNNWKNIFPFHDDKNGKLNVYKGYRRNKSIKASNNFDYMSVLTGNYKIPKRNIEYLEKMIQLSKKHNIKLVFVGFPSQDSWNNTKHKEMTKIAEKYQLPYMNLNLNKDLNINWEKDTKDYGRHLNYYGCKKVSKYIGAYLHSLNILENHKNDLDYYDWQRAYEYYRNY